MRSCIDPTTITVSSITKLSTQGSSCIEWHISRFAVHQVSGLNVPWPIQGRTLRWVFGQVFSTPWNVAGVFLEDSLVTLLLFLILSKCELGLSPHSHICNTSWKQGLCGQIFGASHGLHETTSNHPIWLCVDLKLCIFNSALWSIGHCTTWFSCRQWHLRSTTLCQLLKHLLILNAPIGWSHGCKIKPRPVVKKH